MMDPELEAARTLPTDPQVAQLEFNKAKWYLPKVDRARYGEKVSGDPDQPIEHRVVHSIARSPLDDYHPTTIEGTPIRVEDSSEPRDG